MTTELTFTIPKVWWISSNDRMHWAEKSRRTKSLRMLGYVNSRSMPPRSTDHVAAFIGYLREGRADPSNAAPTVKALIDGMTDAGVWPDDDSAHVIGPTYLRDPKSTTPNHYTVRLVLTPQDVPW